MVGGYAILPAGISSKLSDAIINMVANEKVFRIMDVNEKDKNDFVSAIETGKPVLAEYSIVHDQTLSGFYNSYHYKSTDEEMQDIYALSNVAFLGTKVFFVLILHHDDGRNVIQISLRDSLGTIV